MKRVIILFFTILFGLTCKADDLYTYGNFTYKIVNEKDKQIRLYTFSDSGETTSLDIPSTIVHNNETYSVTQVFGPISNGSNYTIGFIQNTCNINDIYFPSSLSLIAYVSREITTLQYAIFENGDNISNTNYYGIFYNEYTPLSLKYCIIFNNSKKKIKAPYLVGTSNSSKFIENSITISYYNGNKEEISLFLNTKYATYDNTTFDYLLSALQKRGTDLNTISIIDLSEMKQNISFEDNPANILSWGSKIITKNNTYTSTNPVIIDKTNFTPPSTDITADITYNRTNTRDWNSVCLPFNIKESDFGGTSKIYKITAATNNQISLTRVETPETVVDAGTPCFIYSTSDEWNLNLSNVTISNNVAPRPLEVGGNWQVIGSFTNETIGAGKYKLNSSGTEFGITNSENATVTAFRCYIAPTNPRTNAPAQLSVTIDEEASITLVPNDAEPQKVKLYDLMGRPRKEGTQGIFIKSTR